MRFVSLPSGGSGRPVLVDEGARSHSDVAERVPDRTGFSWKLSYGAFFPPVGVPPLIRAKQILRCQGAAFGSHTEDGALLLSEVRRIHLFTKYESKDGKRIYFPCAAVIGTSLDIPPRKSRAPLFLHPRIVAEDGNEGGNLQRSEMGLLALKSEVVKARCVLARDPDGPAWLSFISEETAARVAREIR